MVVSTSTLTAAPHKRAGLGNRRVVVLLLVASALVGVIAALGRRIEPPPACYFVAAWSPHLETGLVPDNLAAANDRRSLAAGKYFSNTTFDFEPSLSASLLRRQLKSDHAGPHKPLVVYLSAYTKVDAAGQLVLMTKDFSPLEPAGHGIPLADVLRLVADNAAEHKLVVLDVAWQLPCGQVGLFPEEIVARAVQKLYEIEDPHRLVLISCSPGQSAHEIPGTGRTAFGYFFEQGLRGHADCYNRAAMSDGRVSVVELAAYVRNRVDAWSDQFAAGRQTPLLVGTGGDFLLGVSDVDRPPPMAFNSAVDEYPDWLRAAWLQREELLAGGTLATHPRLVRRLDRALLEVERRWRYGNSHEHLQTYFRAEIGPVLKQIEKTAPSTRPAAVVAVGQSDVAPAGEHIAAWQNLLISLPAAGGELDPQAAAKVRAQQLAAFQEAVGDPASLESIAAVLETLLTTPGPFARHLATVDHVLHPAHSEPQFVETFLIRKLCELAEQQPTSDETMLRLALRVAVIGEQASGRPRTEPWLAPLLEGAAAHRQAGEVAFFSPGFASPETAGRELNESLAQYQRALELQRTLAGALAERDRAFDQLPALLPIVRQRPSLAETWFQAAEKNCELAARLDRLDPTSLSDQADRIDRLTLDLRQQLDTLCRPTCSEEIDALVGDLNRGQAGKLSAVQALLATPLLSVDDRLRLIEAASAALQEQLETIGTIAADRQAATIDQAVAAARSPVGQPPTSFDRGLLEAKLAVSLGQLAGIDMQRVEALVNERAQNRASVTLSKISQALIGAVRHAVPNDVTDETLPQLDRFARVLPAGFYDPVLDDRERPAPLVKARRVLGAWIARQQGRLTAVAEDVVDWPFLADAALRLAPERSGDRARLDVSGPDEVADFSESSRHATTEFVIHARGKKQPQVTVLRPCDAIETEIDLVRNRDQWLAGIEFQLQPHAAHQALVATRGVLVRVEHAGQMTHHAIRLPGVSQASPVALLVDFAGARRAIRDELELPPTATSQPLVLLMENRSSVPRRLTVNLSAGQSCTTSLELDPGAIKPLKFAPVDGASATVVEEIELQAIDQSTTEQVLSKKFRLTAAVPSCYLQLGDARFLPGENGTHVMRVRVERLPNAPRATTVTLQPVGDGRDEPLVMVAGSLSAKLTEKIPSAELRANLKTRDAATSDATITAAVAADGVAGAFHLTGKTPKYGQGGVLQPASEPLLTVTAEPLVKSGDPLGVSVATVAPPVGGRVRVSLFRPATAGQSSPVLVRHRQFSYVRQKMVTITPPGKDGNLAARAQITDVSVDFDTTGLMGVLTVRAELVDTDGEIPAHDQTRVKCDGTPANLARFVSESAPIVAGAPHAVTLVADDDLSGVDSVQLFVGLPVDDAPPQGAKLLPARRAENSRHRWLAKIPMPKDATSADLTAQITNGVGLARFVSTHVRLVDPKQAARGKIAGGVVEGTRPQPGLEVELRTADQAVVAKATTDAEGKFKFDSVNPGDYLVWCVKQQSQRVGASQVKVEAGATVQTNVELTL